MKRRSLALSLLTLSLSLTSIAGCGSLADPEDPPIELAALDGTLNNTSGVVTSGDLQVAVIWFGGTAETSAEYNVAQKVTVEAKFPASFSLSMTEAPPEDSMNDGVSDDDMSWPAGARYAIGTVVVYEDVNGNGQLDLIPTGATELTDKFVAGDERLIVVYVEGGLPTALEEDPNKVELFFKLGYNTIRLPECVVFCEGEVEEPEINVPIELEIDPNPSLSNHPFCQASAGSARGAFAEDMGTALPAAWPKADDIECSEGGDSYLQIVCETSESLCGPSQETCAHQTWHRPAGPGSEGWPCD